MKILLTGASGRVGSRLAPRLADAGHSVRALVRSPAPGLPLRRPGIDVINGDLGDDAILGRAVRDIDIVVHAAAAFRGVAAAEMDATNIQGTIRLADAAGSAGVARFIFTSTNLVYGPGADRPARESDRLAAEQPYPRSKAAAEAELLTRAGAGALDVRILRFAFVYGEGDPHLAESLRWVRDWPSQKRLHMVHHVDVASGVLAAIDAPPIGERVFNIADDCPVTAQEILTLLGESVSAAAHRSIDAPWESIVDTTLARDLLGFRPRYPTARDAARAGAL